MLEGNPIRVLLADDHGMVRGSLGAIINETPGMKLVGEATNADEAVVACLRDPPDVAILDVDMPGAPFDAARTIIARCPGTSPLFLSAHAHDRYIEAALKSGARAYVCKTDSPETLLHAIRHAAAGRWFFSAAIRDRIVVEEEGVRLREGEGGKLSKLTTREIEVLRFVAHGLSKKEIAEKLHLSVKTVENHATNLMNRLEIHDRVELTRMAIREGLVEP
jgi:DNA-binding NarL/FixJ family response regulator